MRVIKKYPNRRLYDTEKSGYITLEELMDTIRGGDDVRVLDASTGDDLTQATLTQIILERGGAARLLPVDLLAQLIRMDDEALAEFLGKYLSWSLEMYLAMKRGAQAVSPYFPFATLPFSATNAMARMLTGHLPWSNEPPAPPRREPEPPSPEIEELRREIEELKRAVGKKPI
ncbi:MAG TPA: polyhydroxyalkanoate synthesis regulator DNA-binding domain-containing protein [Polyangiaceae bacterium]|jgi:polyhydroxyalkanoate synthesis repressor PhaR|nr:polyhydroxyalkanoate synthesis regulator DNA-binding domain-containing protein [Polyangiaceae bacterium]